MGKLKDQLAGIAALIAAVVAIGGGFAKFGEMQTQLNTLSEQTAPDLTPLAALIGENNKNIAVLQTEVELLNLTIKEMKAKASNPLQ
jgi:hypothetical protein